LTDLEISNVCSESDSSKTNDIESVCNI